MRNSHSIPLGHIITSHQAFGWCHYCPGHTPAEELAAWQTCVMADEIDRLRTENERMVHELTVMYGGAFDVLLP